MRVALLGVRLAQIGKNGWRLPVNVGMLDLLRASEARPVRVGARPVFVGAVALDQAHDLKVFRGLYYCLRCGCIAGIAVQLLRKPCRGWSTEEGRRTLARLGKGLLPRKMISWPDAGDVESRILLG